MVALQIRDVPDEVRDTLTDRAREQGKSLQGYPLELVKHEAERSNNLAILRRFEDRKDGKGDSMEEVVRARWELRADVSACDAGYVAVAEVCGTPLITGDARLGRSKVARCTIEVVNWHQGRSPASRADPSARAVGRHWKDLGMRPIRYLCGGE